MRTTFLEWPFRCRHNPIPPTHPLLSARDLKTPPVPAVSPLPRTSPNTPRSRGEEVDTTLNITVLALALVLPSMATPPPIVPTATGLPAFTDEAAFQTLLNEQTRRAEAKRRKQNSQYEHSVGNVGALPAPPAPAPAAAALESVAVADAAAAGGTESITNNQTQGVDEGDIVKRSGDYLIVLRRGRLFTLRIGGDALQPVSTLNAYGPGVDPSGTWYDEMLVSEHRVVVIGYSYARGGAEITLFDLNPGGGLHYRDTYQLRGRDYYSASNYASRLVGDTLVFYTPIDLALDRHHTITESLPALRHWQPGPTPATFERILPAQRIHRSPLQNDPSEGLTLHSVSQCDLSSPRMQCTATGVLGPSSRVFYVSEDAVYVWTAPWRVDPKLPNRSFVMRIPFDGRIPTGLRASGSPIDHMSFLQRDGWLNVLVASNSAGEGMWAGKGDAGELALLRVPLTAFGDGRRSAQQNEYRPLSSAAPSDGKLHNRFIGDWLLYGTSSWRWQASQGPRMLQAVRYADDSPARNLPLSHDVQRIDALGSNGIAIGNDGHDLMFTSLRLGRGASTAARYVQPSTAQGDDRSHGFFYQPQDADNGLLGLPIVEHGGGPRGTASVLFLRNQSLQLSRAGDLRSRSGNAPDDACKASCVDWYGNARPIFIGNRVFALLGYELVEGQLRDGRIRERRRVDFSPRIPRIAQ